MGQNDEKKTIPHDDAPRAIHEKHSFVKRAGNKSKFIIVGAIVFVAGFAWRDLFKECVNAFLPEVKGPKIIATLVYTLVVSLIAVLLAVMLNVD